MLIKNSSTPKFIFRGTAISGVLLLILIMQTVLILNPAQHLSADGSRTHLLLSVEDGAEEAANCNTSSYQVQPGDTINGVASRAGTTSQRIRECNDLSSDAVYAGQMLNLPGEVNNNQGEPSPVRVARTYRATSPANNNYQAPNNGNGRPNNNGQRGGRPPGGRRP